MAIKQCIYLEDVQPSNYDCTIRKVIHNVWDDADWAGTLKSYVLGVDGKWIPFAGYDRLDMASMPMVESCGQPRNDIDVVDRIK